MTQDSKPDPAGSLSFMGMYSTASEKRLGHYEVGDSLGRGGVSEVYKARDTRLGRWVALKFLQSWAMGNPNLKERLVREAKCASILNHPNIVTVHDIAEERGVIFLVMEYVRGQTLAGLIPAQGLPLDRALDYALQTAHALDAAETAGILHGDLKPLNIMVTEEGRVKLLDFGLAWALVSEIVEQDKPPGMGTTVYMAPERLGDRKIPPNSQSEIFSFGLILHQLLSGRHAFDEESRQEVLEAIQSKSPRELPREVPDPLAKIVERCLEKLPERRFQSMRDLVRALEESSGATIRGSARQFQHPSAPTHQDTPELDQVRALAGRITYANVTQSRKALKELARLLQGSASLSTREFVTTALSDVILTHEAGSNGVPPPVRHVRRIALDVLKLATQGELGSCFPDGELEGLDLFGMDFSGAQLRGVSFKECFLVAADFEDARLSGASFKGARIRNVDFANADLADVDFTDADWFNAASLTGSQFACVLKGTLLDCPPDMEALHRRLGVRYDYSFESWDTDIREQLLNTWNEYLRPGGLRDLVAAWRQTTR